MCATWSKLLELYFLFTSACLREKSARHSSHHGISQGHRLGRCGRRDWFAAVNAGIVRACSFRPQCGRVLTLAARALSRSDKKVLHVDRNSYYGGPDAALTIQDAEEWVKVINEGCSTIFRGASLDKAEAGSDGKSPGSTLGYSRAYSLALSPQIIYARSALLPTLVSSKVYRQLEFLAVGSGWIYQPTEGGTGRLRKIPSNREDVFADKSLDVKSKRAIIRFLRSVIDPDALDAILEEHGNTTLVEFLSAQYGMAPDLQAFVHALTLGPEAPANTRVSWALPRITRHLTSMGVFGPDFGAVIPKWGGLAELTQVACRAQAVGGGVYCLGRDIDVIGVEGAGSPNPKERVKVKLQGGDEIRTRYVIGSRTESPSMSAAGDRAEWCTRSVSIVSSSLPELFPPLGDGAPHPAATIVVFPVGALDMEGTKSAKPVYLMIHSSDTGECPAGQSKFGFTFVCTSI